MYRLMKSEKHLLEHMVSGTMVSYLHIQLRQFPKLGAALAACQAANDTTDTWHYVLDATGKEYYQGTWID